MSLKLRVFLFVIVGVLVSGCTAQKPAVDEDITLQKEETHQKQRVTIEDEPVRQPEAENHEKIIEEESSIPTVEEEDVVEDSENGMAEEEVVEEPKEPSVLAPDVSQENNETVVAEEELSDEATDDNATVESEVAEPEEKIFTPYIEQIGVLKIKISEDELRIMIKDPINKHFYLSEPDRIVIDFKQIRYFEPKSVTVESANVSAIATATHEKYNRVVIYLKNRVKYAISKDKGDWLISLK